MALRTALALMAIASGCRTPPEGFEGAPADLGRGVFYAAQRHLTDRVDRIDLIKGDPARGVCVRLRMESPAPPGPVALTLPEGWGVIRGTIEPVLRSGECGARAPDGAEEAAAGAGWIAWTFDPPCQLDAAASLDFPRAGREPIRTSIQIHWGCWCQPCPDPPRS